MVDYKQRKKNWREAGTLAEVNTKLHYTEYSQFCVFSLAMCRGLDVEAKKIGDGYDSR